MILLLIFSIVSQAKDLPNRTCHRLFAVEEAARAKYLLCFQRGTLAELDFSQTPLSGETFGRIPLKVKECHVNQAPLVRSYGEVKKIVKERKWELHFSQISARFTEAAYRHDDLTVRQDGAPTLDATSAIDSIGAGWCFWREKPLRQQAKDENCVNALACSELTPEFCDCTW